MLFAALFKVLPDARISWRSVWVGAAVTAALFVVGKFLIGAEFTETWADRRGRGVVPEPGAVRAGQEKPRVGELGTAG